jgi:hypothetical protein
MASPFFTLPNGRPDVLKYTQYHDNEAIPIAFTSNSTPESRYPFDIVSIT